MRHYTTKNKDVHGQISVHDELVMQSWLSDSESRGF